MTLQQICIDGSQDGWCRYYCRETDDEHIDMVECHGIWHLFAPCRTNRWTGYVGYGDRVGQVIRLNTWQMKTNRRDTFWREMETNKRDTFCITEVDWTAFKQNSTKETLEIQNHRLLTAEQVVQRYVDYSHFQTRSRWHDEHKMAIQSSSITYWHDELIRSNDWEELIHTQ